MEHLKIEPYLIVTLSANTTVLNCLLYLNTFTCRYFRQVRISKLLLFELARRHRPPPGFLDGAFDMGIGDMR